MDGLPGSFPARGSAAWQTACGWVGAGDGGAETRDAPIDLPAAAPPASRGQDAVDVPRVRGPEARCAGRVDRRAVRMPEMLSWIPGGRLLSSDSQPTTGRRRRDDMPYAGEDADGAGDEARIAARRTAATLTSEASATCRGQAQAVEDLSSLTAWRAPPPPPRSANVAGPTLNDCGDFRPVSALKRALAPHASSGIARGRETAGRRRARNSFGHIERRKGGTRPVRSL